ncbi:MAG: PadR family transcriptional regulator [Nocardioides sp.]|uniref:PadR family transcriptional regulator n=1 Tax=Nocardioides sp. TaxID=35761 RepID=UPI003F0B0945
MSIRHAMLALLEQGPKYGYQLRQEFEERTGATWPLNVGQVYTTLGRLSRDGLVAAVDHGGADGGESDRQVSYELTDAGRTEVADWFATPVPREQPERDELAIKLAIAVTLPGVDVGVLIQRQRATTMAALQEYTRLKRKAGVDATAAPDLAWSLVLDSLVFETEAELRWLDHCDTRLRRIAASRREVAPASPSPTTPTRPSATLSTSPENDPEAR